MYSEILAHYFSGALMTSSRLDIYLSNLKILGATIINWLPDKTPI
ncbi:hypothetical protein VIBNIWn13_260059 [Vibrio nigripulchritudo Wn13]|nr:hypothetical protein VIBNISFn135_800059 [Vibrio nigripulchritudo SFn135]CCO52217.1 hypothetical protein VIBNIWn13_260059 [Vibrio nigripulchritudo Wn13]